MHTYQAPICEVRFVQLMTDGVVRSVSGLSLSQREKGGRGAIPIPQVTAVVGNRLLLNILRMRININIIYIAFSGAKESFSCRSYRHVCTQA